MLRKTTKALFRMAIAKHLHRFECLQTSTCIFCKEDAIMNKSNFSECKALSGGNLTTLYCEARGKMMQINYFLVPLDKNNIIRKKAVRVNIWSETTG